MPTTRPTSSSRFPPPHRAPGVLDELSGASSEDSAVPGSEPDQRRYQRAIDGWMATRIRKQSRRWRQH